MFAFLGPSWQWVVLLVVVLLLFGHRIPGMARALGGGISEFKKGLKEGAEKGPPPDAGSEPPKPPA